MRLNLCCGKRYREGWTNIDVIATPDERAPDILADVKSIPLPDDCADEIICVHGFEHVYRYDVDEVMIEWKRLLKPGGLLVLELPDLVKCCENVLSGYTRGDKDPEQFSLWGLFGDWRLRDPWMVHRWAWSPKSLKAFLKSHGFVDIVSAETQWHPAGRERRDQRMEARKPASA